MATAAEVAALLQRITTLEGIVTEMSEKLQKEKEKERGREEKILTARKGYQNIRKYGGKPETFHSWKYKMEMFLEGEDKHFVKFLKWIEGQVDEITKEDLNDYDLNEAGADVEWMNRQLYLLLAATLEEDSPQLALVQNLREKDDVRGAVAWAMIVRDATGMNGTRLQALARKVHSPEKVKKYSEVLAAVEQWTLHVSEFERATDSKVPDVAKFTALRQLVPKELDADIGRLNNVTEFKELKKYVFEQVNVRREPYFHPMPGISAGQGTKPMEVDELQYGQYEAEEWQKTEGNEGGDESLNYIGPKGKGKGKGKGQFQGEYHHCGQYGHRLNQCWLKDQEMQSKGWSRGGRQDKG